MGSAPVYRQVEACNKVLLGSELPPPSSVSSSVSVGLPVPMADRSMLKNKRDYELRTPEGDTDVT